MKELKYRGVIVVNAYTQSETELNQSKRLKEEFDALGIHAEIMRNWRSVQTLEKGSFDFCVYLDKDKYAARILQKNFRLFNRAEAIETCDDKMLTHLALDGFPMPETIAGTLCYTPDMPVDGAFLDRVEGELGYPVIIKECYGSLGKGVHKADTRADLERIAEQVKLRPHLFQRFIAKSSGLDVRVIVIGGEVVACMKRRSESDFRSNAELGGKGEPYALSREGEYLCKAVAKKLKLDYCGIDLLLGDEFLVCEVNSNAFFGTIEKVTGINVAKQYAEYIKKEIYGDSIH